MLTNSKHAWLKPYILLICLLGAPITAFTSRASSQSSAISKQSFSASGRATTTLRKLDSGRTREAGVGGVNVKFEAVSGSGVVPSPTQTDDSGNWSRSGFVPGVTYKATPSRNGFFFTPTRR
ncbi:MAG: hypothetical protein ACREAB_10445 [Blastocatellia bacterium]